MVNPYAPQEPPEIIWLEHADFAGICLSLIAYGITIIIFFQCLYALLHRSNYRGQSPNWFLIVYTVVMFGLGTVFIILNTRLEQLGFIDNRNFPGGPTAYGLSQYSKAPAVAPNAAFIIANWLADGLLMYRCFVIFYNAQRWVIAFPIVIYLASITMGILLLYQTTRPEANIFTTVSVSFGLPYFSISVALNIILTLLISSRLLFHRRKLTSSLGEGHAASAPYTSIVTMLIESSALYAVVSILFIGPYGAGNYASDLFLPLLSQVQIIGPLLIIFRVANRRAWTSTTATSVTKSATMGESISFAPALNSSTRSQDTYGDTGVPLHIISNAPDMKDLSAKNRVVVAKTSTISVV